MPWTGGKTPAGYGGVFVGHRNHGAHVVAYSLAHAIPLDLLRGRVIRHQCHNPICVNPEHLLVGTPKQNSEDMVRAGRSPRGEKQHLSKLNAEVVASIRIEYSAGKAYMRELAERHGVTLNAIFQVIHRQTWRHVK